MDWNHRHSFIQRRYWPWEFSYCKTDRSRLRLHLFAWVLEHTSYNHFYSAWLDRGIWWPYLWLALWNDTANIWVHWFIRSAVWTIELDHDRLINFWGHSFTHTVRILRLLWKYIFGLDKSHWLNILSFIQRCAYVLAHVWFIRGY